MNEVWQGDCLEEMKRIEDNSIDLTVTSPPYDNLRDYKGYTFDFEGIARELYRVTKDGGVVVWVVGDQTTNGSESGTSFKQALYFKEIGFNLHDTMIYDKKNPVPLTHNRYEQKFEYMFVFSKGKPKTFNGMKEDTKGGSSKFNAKVPEQSTRQKSLAQEVKEKRLRYNIWSYNVSLNDRTTHPAPFPEQLAKDHILSWSNEGDLVLDPFLGSGTTAKMAYNLKRNYIGIDISEEYCEIARKRIAGQSSPLL